MSSLSPSLLLPSFPLFLLPSIIPLLLPSFPLLPSFLPFLVSSFLLCFHPIFVASLFCFFHPSLLSPPPFLLTFSFPSSIIPSFSPSLLPCFSLYSSVNSFSPSFSSSPIILSFLTFFLHSVFHYSLPPQLYSMLSLFFSPPSCFTSSSSPS